MEITKFGECSWSVEAPPCVKSSEGLDRNTGRIFICHWSLVEYKALVLIHAWKSLKVRLWLVGTCSKERTQVCSSKNEFSI